MPERTLHCCSFSSNVLSSILVHHTVILFLLQNRVAYFLYFYLLVKSVFPIVAIQFLQFLTSMPENDPSVLHHFITTFRAASKDSYRYRTVETQKPSTPHSDDPKGKLSTITLKRYALASTSTFCNIT